MKKAEIILHPIRLRIIQSFFNNQEKTAKNLAKELKDIPQATLYRHLDVLVKNEVLVVTQKNQIRGTVEKTYTLSAQAANLTQDDLNETTREEHMQYFTLFVTQLMNDYENYLQKDEYNLEQDGVGYRQAALYLDDTEFADMMNELKMVFQKYSGKEPTESRTRRLISTIIMPEYGRGNEDE